MDIKETANYFNHCNLTYGKILGTAILKWKIILLISSIFAFLGWLDSYSKYNKYRVTTRISLSKILDISYFNAQPSKEQAVVDPNIFLMYIQDPNNYEIVANVSCGFDKKNSDFNSFFVKSISIRFETTPISNYVVEMKGNNFDYMKNCIQGISQNIISFQDQLTQNYVNLIKEELIANEKKINSLRSSKSKSSIDNFNFETEELKFLLPISIQLQSAIKHSSTNSGKILSSAEAFKIPLKFEVRTLLSFLFV